MRQITPKTRALCTLTQQAPSSLVWHFRFAFRIFYSTSIVRLCYGIVGLWQHCFLLYANNTASSTIFWAYCIGRYLIHILLAKKTFLVIYFTTNLRHHEVAITINNLNNKGLQHFVYAWLEWKFYTTHPQNNSDTSIFCELIFIMLKNYHTKLPQDFDTFFF